MVPPPPLPAGQFFPGGPTNGDRGQGNVQPEVHRTSTPTNNNGSRFQSVRSTLARPFHFVAALNPGPGLRRMGRVERSRGPMTAGPRCLDAAQNRRAQQQSSANNPARKFAEDRLLFFCGAFSFIDALCRLTTNFWAHFMAEKGKPPIDMIQFEKCLECTPDWSQMTLLLQLLASALLMSAAKRGRYTEYLPWLVITPCVVVMIFQETVCIWSEDAAFRAQGKLAKCYPDVLDLFQQPSVPSDKTATTWGFIEGHVANAMRMAYYAVYVAVWTTVYIIVLQKYLLLTCWYSANQMLLPSPVPNRSSRQRGSRRNGTRRVVWRSPTDETSIIIADDVATASSAAGNDDGAGDLSWYGGKHFIRNEAMSRSLTRLAGNASVNSIASSSGSPPPSYNEVMRTAGEANNDLVQDTSTTPAAADPTTVNFQVVTTTSISLNAPNNVAVTVSDVPEQLPTGPSNDVEHV